MKPSFQFAGSLQRSSNVSRVTFGFIFLRVNCGSDGHDRVSFPDRAGRPLTIPTLNKIFSTSRAPKIRHYLQRGDLGSAEDRAGYCSQGIRSSQPNCGSGSLLPMRTLVVGLTGRFCFWLGLNRWGCNRRNEGLLRRNAVYTPAERLQFKTTLSN